MGRKTLKQEIDDHRSATRHRLALQQHAHRHRALRLASSFKPDLPQTKAAAVPASHIHNPLHLILAAVEEAMAIQEKTLQTEDLSSVSKA